MTTVTEVNENTAEAPKSLSPPEYVLDYTPRFDASRRRLVFFGFLIILLGFGGLGAWAALAPLQSAAVAPGIVKVASERKKVQHLEGGIVKEILIKEGDQVEAGQVLIRLDDVAARSRVELLQRKLDGMKATLARLKAEIENRDSIEFPQELLDRRDDPKIAKMLEGEEQVFRTRRESLEGEKAVLRQRNTEYGEQVKGVQEQIRSTRKQLQTIKEELKAASVLYKKGIYEKPKYLSLVRASAKLEGQIGKLRSSIAQVKQRMAEIELRIIDLDKKRREEVNADLQRYQTNIFDTEERLRTARDTLRRVDIRAPQSGEVVGLTVHTVGGVIPPRATILEIVPRNDKLVIEATVRPADIDIVHEGLQAEVRLTAFNRRTTPALPGRLTRLSADRFATSDGTAFYRAVVEIDPKHTRDLDLYPGMPAEVYLLTGKRTMLEYLIKPIQDSMRRGLIEK